MDCRSCGWKGTNQWEITFWETCKSQEEANAVEKKARRAVGKMKGAPRTKVYTVGTVIFAELKYSRGTILREFKTEEAQAIAKSVISEFNRKY